MKKGQPLQAALFHCHLGRVEQILLACHAPNWEKEEIIVKREQFSRIFREGLINLFSANGGLTIYLALTIGNAETMGTRILDFKYVYLLGAIGVLALALWRCYRSNRGVDISGRE